jgi:hypothetical protein
LDDITARAAAWCEQARGLGGSVIGDAMGDGAPRAPGGAETLAARLDVDATFRENRRCFSRRHLPR